MLAESDRSIIPDPNSLQREKKQQQSAYVHRWSLSYGATSVHVSHKSQNKANNDTPKCDMQDCCFLSKPEFMVSTDHKNVSSKLHRLCCSLPSRSKNHRYKRKCSHRLEKHQHATFRMSCLRPI